ncbi:MAG TPA: hypothetical protein VH590_02045 [Ktedonobacterales bacterium]|jgi:hypothetical protein
MIRVLLLPLAAASVPDANTLFLWEALLDLLGVIAAIWTLWIFAWLPLKGIAMSAFRLIAVGGLIFALLHVLDTLFSVWTILPSGLPFLIHWGLVLVSMVYFLFGLARLADAVSVLQYPQDNFPAQHWWPMAVGLSLFLLALSFIVYGFKIETVFWALMALNAGIAVLALACVVQVWRAHLGGALGGALYLALLGLLIFSLAHPAQTWFSTADIVSGPIVPLLHRLAVIPAFLLFSASIARLSRALAPRMAQRAAAPVGSRV